MAEEAIQYDPDDDVGLVNFSFSAYLTLLHQKELFLIEHPDTEVKMGIIETIEGTPATKGKKGKKGKEGTPVKYIDQKLPIPTGYKKGVKGLFICRPNSSYLAEILYPTKGSEEQKAALFEEEKNKDFENLKIYWKETVKSGLPITLPPMTGHLDEELGGGKRRKGTRKGTRRRKNKSKRFSIKKGV